MMGKSILNYTSSISVEKTLGEIQALLARTKAQQILTDLNEEGVVTAISFRITGKFGMLTYRLPAKVQQVYQVLVRSKKIERRYKTMEQAARVSWRIILNWLEAQLAFLETEQVDLEQLFLAYVQQEDGAMLYETLRD